nr:glucan biosynthesis protein [Verrucomicrobiota bacterium]
LLDSPRATGAYRFDIQPGAQTTTTVRSRIFVRAASGTHPIATLGVAPLTSMFFHGAMNERFFDDFRPQVHDSDGLLLAGGLYLGISAANLVSLHAVDRFADLSWRGITLVQALKLACALLILIGIHTARRAEN